MSQEFSRTENRMLGALARLDDFLMNPLIQGHSGTVPETPRNVFTISQGTKEDDCQSNPHPEIGLFNNQMTQNSGPEDDHDSFNFTGSVMTNNKRTQSEFTESSGSYYAFQHTRACLPRSWHAQHDPLHWVNSGCVLLLLVNTEKVLLEQNC